MSLILFKKALGDVRFAIDKAQKAGLTIAESGAISRDFRSQQRNVIAQDVLSSINSLERESKSLSSLAEENEEEVIQILALIRQLKAVKDLDRIKELVHLLRNHLSEIEASGNSSFLLKLPFVPAEIRSQLESDVLEISNCFEHGCYRSVVILCGRVLEVALHRKYFDSTGIDLLEKAPGTGLGNLIGKLAEKGVVIDPALTNQIHLINQVRVSSVHVKKEAFRPNSDQSQAIILYTFDVLKKLFS
jgi:hypothetical protein